MVPPGPTADGGRVVVLDDDPTGVQTLSGAQVLIEWTDDRLRDTLEQARSVHLLTNSRAYPAGEAREIVGSAAAIAQAAAPEAAIVLRGDSTLRGHVLEEYLAVGGVAASGRHRPLLLAPALPTAGRVTIGGVQYLERDGRRLPVHLTEFAADGPFAYTSSRLLEWAEERSRGLFAADGGIEVGLASLRGLGPDAVVDAARRSCAARAPTAVALDAETDDDVELVAEGFRRAIASGSDVVLRCGPAVAGALGGATATTAPELPSSERVLVVCGSYVPQSVRQVATVVARYPDAVVEVDPQLLVAGDRGLLGAAADEIARRLDSPGLAVVTVSPVRPQELANLTAGLDVARGLAGIVRAVDRPDLLVVLKGGVTSAVTLDRGLGAVRALIEGPVLPGVALWSIRDPAARSVLVVPGNVGDDHLLVRIIESAWVGR